MGTSGRLALSDSAGRIGGSGFGDGDTCRVKESDSAYRTPLRFAGIFAGINKTSSVKILLLLHVKMSVR